MAWPKARTEGKVMCSGRRPKAKNRPAPIPPAKPSQDPGEKRYLSFKGLFKLYSSVLTNDHKSTRCHTGMLIDSRIFFSIPLPKLLDAIKIPSRSVSRARLNG